MPRRNCPRCEADISETYQGYDPDVGIMGSSWFCEECDLVVEEDDQDYEYDGEFD